MDHIKLNQYRALFSDLVKESINRFKTFARFNNWQLIILDLCLLLPILIPLLIRQKQSQIVIKDEANIEEQTEIVDSAISSPRTPNKKKVAFQQEVTSKEPDNPTIERKANSDDKMNAASATNNLPLIKVSTDDKIDLSSHRFSKEIKKALRHFLDVVESPATSELWESVYTGQNETVIFQHRSLENCYRIHTVLENTPETCFDVIADVTKRPFYDEMCDEGRVIEELDANTRIVYVKMKAIWPTAARDCVLVSHVRRMTDGRLLNVTKSVTHPDCPDLTMDGIVRMEAGIAGQICEACEGDAQTPNFCRVIQIVDGDLKGWIPKSVIRFVATKGLPTSLKKLNDLVASMEVNTESAIVKSPKKEVATATTKQEPQKDDDDELIEDEFEQVEAPKKEVDEKKAKASTAVTKELLKSLKSLEDRIKYLETLLTGHIQRGSSSSNSLVRTIFSYLRNFSPILFAIAVVLSLIKWYRNNKK